MTHHGVTNEALHCEEKPGIRKSGQATISETLAISEKPNKKHVEVISHFSPVSLSPTCSGATSTAHPEISFSFSLPLHEQYIQQHSYTHTYHTGHFCLFIFHLWYWTNWILWRCLFINCISIRSTANMMRAQCMCQRLALNQLRHKSSIAQNQRCNKLNLDSCTHSDVSEVAQL